MEQRNIVLFDSNEKEASEYLEGVRESTDCEWDLKVVTANEGRECRLYNLKRYMKYFTCPFNVFLNRKKYKTIIGWQAFYGIILAFYCRLFHVKKSFKLIVQHFIYKPKKGFVGKLYYKFLQYAIGGGYIDLIISCSRDYVDIIRETFGLKMEQVAFAPFGVNDFRQWVNQNDLQKKDYILSVGRSNRDWEFLIQSLADCGYSVIICCDELKVKELPENIIVKNDVNGLETFKYMQNCKCAVIPIKDGALSSGETVLLQQMCFEKPIIITEPSSLASDYIVDGYNGISIKKDEKSLCEAINQIYSSDELSSYLAQNARKDFEEKFSLRSHGKAVGKIINHKKLV